MSLPGEVLTIKLGRCPVHGWTTEFEEWEVDGQTGIYCKLHEDNGQVWDHECVLCEEKISEVKSFSLHTPMNDLGEWDLATIMALLDREYAWDLTDPEKPSIITPEIREHLDKIHAIMVKVERTAKPNRAR